MPAVENNVGSKSPSRQIVAAHIVGSLNRFFDRAGTRVIEERASISRVQLP